jgi:hypothetical protein
MTTGQSVGSIIGVLAVLLLAWWTVGIGSLKGTRSPWQFVVVLTVGIALGLTVILIPREQYLLLFRRHFGWIPVALGTLSYWYWLWYTGGGSVDVGFFETAAQVLPVLLLAAVVEVRQASILKTHQLALPIIAVFLGEVAALNEAGFQTGATAEGRVPADFAVVASSLVTAVAALIMAVLADLKQDSPDAGPARSGKAPQYQAATRTPSGQSVRTAGSASAEVNKAQPS